MKSEVGQKGEELAVKYLEDMGLSVCDRNVRYKWGEIDIVARERVRGVTKYHFVEVKAVTRERTGSYYDPLQNVSREKLSRLRKAVQTYISHKKITEDWEFSVVSVVFDAKNGGVCEWIRHVIL